MSEMYDDVIPESPIRGAGSRAKAATTDTWQCTECGLENASDQTTCVCQVTDKVVWDESGQTLASRHKAQKEREKTAPPVHAPPPLERSDQPVTKKLKLTAVPSTAAAAAAAAPAASGGGGGGGDGNVDMKDVKSNGPQIANAKAVPSEAAAAAAASPKSKPPAAAAPRPVASAMTTAVVAVESAEVKKIENLKRLAERCREDGKKNPSHVYGYNAQDWTWVYETHTNKKKETISYIYQRHKFHPENRVFGAPNEFPLETGIFRADGRTRLGPSGDYGGSIENREQREYPQTDPIGSKQTISVGQGVWNPDLKGKTGFSCETFDRIADAIDAAEYKMTYDLLNTYPPLIKLRDLARQARTNELKLMIKDMERKKELGECNESDIPRPGSDAERALLSRGLVERDIKRCSWYEKNKLQIRENVKGLFARKRLNTLNPDIGKEKLVGPSLLLTMNEAKFSEAKEYAMKLKSEGRFGEMSDDPFLTALAVGKVYRLVDRWFDYQNKIIPLEHRDLEKGGSSTGPLLSCKFYVSFGFDKNQKLEFQLEFTEPRIHQQKSDLLVTETPVEPEMDAPGEPFVPVAVRRSAAGLTMDETKSIVKFLVSKPGYAKAGFKQTGVQRPPLLPPGVTLDMLQAPKDGGNNSGGGGGGGGGRPYAAIKS